MSENPMPEKSCTTSQYAEIGQDFSRERYVCGDLSAADFGLLPWIYGYGRFDLLDGESILHVRAWLDRMTARPSFGANFQVEGRPFEAG